MKLYRQFGHCGSTKLLKVLKIAGKLEKSLEHSIPEAIAGSDICQMYGRIAGKPEDSCPLSRAFNELIAADLHQLTLYPEKNLVFAHY